jgi:hypothetical protein
MGDEPSDGRESLISSSKSSYQTIYSISIPMPLPPPPYLSDEKVTNKLSSIVEKCEAEYKKKMGELLIVNGEVISDSISRAHYEAASSALTMHVHAAQDQSLRDFIASKDLLGKQMKNWHEKLITESGRHESAVPCVCRIVILLTGLLMLHMLYTLMVMTPTLWSTLDMRSLLSNSEHFQKVLGTSIITAAGSTITIMISYMVIKYCFQQMYKYEQPKRDHMRKFLSENGFSSDHSFLYVAI